MQFSREDYARKRICNGSSIWIENFLTRDNCSTSLGKPRHAEQLPSWWNFESEPQDY